MTVPARPRECPPTHPGVFVREDILVELGMTQQQLAVRLGVSRRSISQIVNAQRGISADMALRLGKFTGTSAEFWMHLQEAWDLWHARQSVQTELNNIQTLVA
jgi:addiction module HigA family antidote